MLTLETHLPQARNNRPGNSPAESNRSARPLVRRPQIDRVSITAADCCADARRISRLTRWANCDCRSSAAGELAIVGGHDERNGLFERDGT